MVLIRDYTFSGPDGAVVRMKWYGTRATSAPKYIVNLTVGPGAGSSWLKEADRYAQTVGPDAVAQIGGTVDPPEHISIQGAPGIVYTDFLGWVSVSWFPSPDIVISVTSWKAARASLEHIAQQVVMH
jgi:hypothetical protein